MTQAIFVPVHDERGSAMLYDIYVDGEWVGSKRTIQQCEDRIQISTGRLTHDRYLNLLVADMPAARAQECAQRRPAQRAWESSISENPKVALEFADFFWIDHRHRARPRPPRWTLRKRTENSTPKATKRKGSSRVCTQ
jgi:hypothetical protein